MAYKIEIDPITGLYTQTELPETPTVATPVVVEEWEEEWEEPATPKQKPPIKKAAKP